MTNLLIRIFIKNYKEVSNTKVREAYGKLSSIVGILSNFLLFIFKISTGLVFNSIAIIADAINNLSDSGSSLITLLGFKISGKPADAEHPYGHARMEYISGLIVSFIILFLGLELIKTSFEKILHPNPVQFSLLSVIVLTAAIFIKLWQSFFYRKIGKKIDSLTLMATSADSRNDVLSTAAVLLSIIITYFTGINLDGYMGMLVALFIVISGVKLVIDTINPLLGTAPTKEMSKGICEKILSYDHIIGVHDLAVHNYGPEKCFVSVHCEVPAEQDIVISHEIIDKIERDFLEEMGIHLVIHLDPVDTSNPKTNELKAVVVDLIKQISPLISLHDFRVVWGASQSNLIFDIVIPFDFQLHESGIKKMIEDRMHELDPSYRCVITVDYSSIEED